MKKEVISTKNAPGAIGPYVQGYKIGDLVFTSGQIPIDMKTGEFPEDIKEQTRCSLRNVSAILEEAGTTLDNVIKATVFIKDMEQFPLINEAYSEFFPNSKPARSCVEVARLPKDAGIEIEVIATI